MNEENDLSQYIDAINQTSSPDESIRQPALEFLQSCTFKLELLEPFENLFKTALTDQSTSLCYFSLLVLRDLIKNRGCLLEHDDLITHVTNLLTYSDNFSMFLAGQTALKNILADSLSISFRFLIDAKIKVDIITDPLFQFYQKSDYHKIIALTTIISIIDVAQLKMKHVTIKQANDIRRNFHSQYLHHFLDFAFDSISIIPEGHSPEAVPIINLSGIKLLTKICNCTYDISGIKKDCFEFNEKSEMYIEHFFIFFRSFDGDDSNESLDALCCYYELCLKQINQKSIDPYPYIRTLLFIISKTTEMMQMEEEIPNLIPILLCISKSFSSKDLNIKYIKEIVASDLQPDEDRNEDMLYQPIHDFIAGLITYTDRYIQNNYTGFFEIWSELVKNLDNEINGYTRYQSICEKSYELFQMYFDQLMSDADLESRSESFFENYEIEIENHKCLWKMIKFNLVPATALISEAIKSIIEQTTLTETYQRLQILFVLYQSFLPVCTSMKADDNSIKQSLTEIFDSIRNIILWESDSMDERLGSLGALFPKSEFLLAKFFESYLNNHSKNKNVTPIRNFIKNFELILKKKIEDFFIIHLVDDIKSCIAFPNLLLFIFDLFSILEKNSPNILGNNETLNQFAQERVLPPNLASDFESVKSIVPKLYNLYSKSIIYTANENDTWAHFLSTFDQQFSPELTVPENCFILFSQLKGVFEYSSSASKEVQSATFDWMVRHHFDDFMKTISSHSKNKTLIFKMISTWLKLSSYKPNSNTQTWIIDCTNGDGIEYFHCNTTILNALKEFGEESEWPSMKLIYDCICGDYANYGLMQYYQDNSLIAILDAFFYLLQNWALGESPNRLIKMTKILLKLSNLKMIKTYVFPSDERIHAVFEFLIQNMLIQNTQLWIETCNGLYGIILEAIEIKLPDPEANKAFYNYMSQFFIVIVDMLVLASLEDLADDLSLSEPATKHNNAKEREIITSSANSLFLVMRCIMPLIGPIMTTITNVFEESYAEQAKEIFLKLLDPNLNGLADEEAVMPNPNFKDILQEFSFSIKRYPIHISSIPEFQDIFRRNQKTE